MRILARPASTALRNADLRPNLFDPAAPDDKVVRVKHGGLAGCDGSLRFVENHFGEGQPSQLAVLIKQPWDQLIDRCR